MQGLLHETRERAMIQSILKIEGDPQALVGLQFWCRPPGKVELEKVEVVAEAESGKGFKVREVNGEAEFEEVDACQFRIGRGRQSGEPLMQLLNKHGFETEPYQQREEFRTPASRSGSVSSSQRRGGAAGEGVGGFRLPRAATPAPGLGIERAGSAQGNPNVRGVEGEWGQRRRQVPFGPPEFGEMGVGRSAPFAPVPLRSPQIPYQANYGMGNQIPLENQYLQFARGTQPRQPANQTFGMQHPHHPYENQQGGGVGNDPYMMQGPAVGGNGHGQNQQFMNQGVPQQLGGQGQPQQTWGYQGAQAGFAGAGAQQGLATIGEGRVGSAGARSDRSGRGVQEAGGTTKEVMERLAAFEKKLNIQSARTGVEAELRRQQAQINPEKNPGLFAQTDLASTIYSAPRCWGGPVSLAGGLSSVLKVPTSKLAFLGDELVSTTLQKCREAGENLTEEQIAAIESATLELTGPRRPRRRSSWHGTLTGLKRGE
jgi:hypothetical protein